MHKNAMQTLAQTRLLATIRRSGMTDAELATALGVNQSTISRLKHGRIAKVLKHQKKLDEYLGLRVDGVTDDLSELIAMSQSSPALREVLVTLQRLMHEDA
ncbi:MAG: helix-turn-helix transcriptional regulator [Bradyrhizobium sp.]|nr:helix-turn-helix transcriptional regulator [Bradyrhizobium sp.]